MTPASTTRRLGLGPLVLLLLALGLSLPVLSVLASWLQWTPQTGDLLREMASTVLPDYARTSLLLCLLVAAGVTLLGLGAAVAVSLFDFRGRSSFEWLLLLPLAMPAYVVAYAYTDFLQFSGPLQQALREAFGWRGALWPDVRSVWGAALVFTLTLYPYVYLLARTALLERAGGLMEAARLLGASWPRRVREVALPLARPAVAAGVALALMETLADFGVSSYFGIQTFTAGIYKAWLAMDDRVAAAQLATALLAVVLLLLHLEQRAERRMRFVQSRGARQGSAESRPVRLRGRQHREVGLGGQALQARARGLGADLLEVAAGSIDVLLQQRQRGAPVVEGQHPLALRPLRQSDQVRRRAFHSIQAVLALRSRR